MTKQKIILVGCGEHARMVIDNIEEQGGYSIFGLTTNTDIEKNTSVMGYPVVCLDKDIPKLLHDNPDIKGYFLCVGVKKMKIRYLIYSEIDKLIEPINIIHPASIISKYSHIGKGNLIEAYTKIANGVKMGKHCILNSFSAINHDQIIEDNVLIAGNVSMAGISIGAHTIIADGASIAFKKFVGRNCIIGDGAVITHNIPDNSIVIGNPGRVIRKNIW